jgi:lysophospholipid acyltransferase (LPLAT)-like uncharacterized protein
MHPSIKRLLRSAPFVRVVANAIAFYIRLVGATSRWQTIGAEQPRRFWDADKPFIGVFWHGRLLMMPLAWTTRHTMRVLISQHRDGELIARTMDPFGIGTIRGSGAKAGKKDKGGRAALRSILEALKQGEYVTFTPDGPRGPRMRVSTGVIAAARLARVPILPATYAVARRRVINSWDRFLLPWPFNRGVFLWGEPIDVYSNKTETAEQAAQRVEAIMNALCAQADRLCGQSPIEPAERLAPPSDGDSDTGGDA